MIVAELLDDPGGIKEVDRLGRSTPYELSIRERRPSQASRRLAGPSRIEADKGLTNGQSYCFLFHRALHATPASPTRAEYRRYLLRRCLVGVRQC